MHFLQLAVVVKEGTIEEGMVGFHFNIMGVSDAIPMPAKGMSYNLQFRDLVADRIETVLGAQWYDANVSLPGCDKNMHGTLMEMGCLNLPSFIVYGGTIKLGHFQGHTYDIILDFKCYGEYVNGSITNE